MMFVNSTKAGATWLLAAALVLSFSFNNVASAKSCPPPSVCDDHNPCTVDTCSASTGFKCVNTRKPKNSSCSDGNVCNGSETCDAHGVCKPGAPPSNGTACNDGKSCTTGDVCTGGTCAGSARACPAGQTCTEASGVCQDACTACEQAHLSPPAADGCNPQMGCEHITTGAADVALCQALLSCMRTTQCWLDDPTTCLCGSATGSACLTGAANGACKAQVLAATKTPEIPLAGTRFYDFAFPAGFAAQQIACDHDFCSPAASPPSTACVAPTCAGCEQSHVASGDCDARIGCEHITTGAADVAACQGLRDCMNATGCWRDDPVDCLCGTAKGTACLTAPNGVCKAQVQAATKSTNPVDNGTRFYDFAFPAGFATQQIACGRDYCSPAASPPSNACLPGQACLGCEQSHVPSGECDAHMGCENVTTGAADVALCQGLRDCMNVTGCWRDDPVDCLCGTAKGTACLTGSANGVCKAQVQAATKSTNPVENGTRFYDFAFPAGFATQQVACARDYCSPAATPPSNACLPGDACLQCEAIHIGSGDCDARIGCEHVTTGAADVALCQSLLSCMTTTKCGSADPLDCLCGTARGAACLSAANGVCKAQVQAATKSTNLVDNGTRFYDFAFPAAFATQEIACRHDFCSPAECP